MRTVPANIHTFIVSYDWFNNAIRCVLMVLHPRRLTFLVVKILNTVHELTFYGAAHVRIQIYTYMHIDPLCDVGVVLM